MSAVLTIGHVPGHGPDSTARTVALMAGHHFDSAAPSEAYRIADELQRQHEFRAFGTSHYPARKGDPGHRIPGWDCPVLVDREHQILGHGYTFGSKTHPPYKWNPTRVINWAAYEHDLGTVCHIAAHPDPGGGLSRQYRAVMLKVAKRVRWAKRKGHHVIVSGDLQVSAALRYGKPWHPRPLFHSLGMEYRNTGIDWIAWTPPLKLTGTPAVISPRRLTPGADHPWMFVRLTK